jgi:hypothetical protein
MFDKDQEIAYNLTNVQKLVLSGHEWTDNIYLVKHQCKHNKGNHTYVVCSTEIAATHYCDMGPEAAHILKTVDIVMKSFYTWCRQMNDFTMSKRTLKLLTY